MYFNPNKGQSAPGVAFPRGICPAKNGEPTWDMDFSHCRFPTHNDQTTSDVACTQRLADVGQRHASSTMQH